MRIDLGLSRKIIETAVRKGAEEAELLAIYSKSITTEVKKGELDFLQHSNDQGFAIRVIKDSRQGLSFSTEPSAYEECIRTALESATCSEQDPFLELPEKCTIPEIETFDPEIQSLKETDLEAMALNIEENAFASDRRIKKTRKTSVGVTLSGSIIVNSRGVEALVDSTSISAFITVIAEENEESYTGWDYWTSRFLNDIPFQDIGKTASARALRLLGSRKITPMKSPVLLENHIAADFLGILAPAFSAENIQNGKSLLREKLGTPIAADIVNLTDNPLMDRVPGSRPFDAEGVPGQKKVIVERGIMKQALYNTWTANRDKTASTGNAVRSGLSSLPSVGVTNFFLSPSDKTAQQPQGSMISTIDRGILVTDAMGVHTANPISGDFSIGISGMYIVGGEVQYPFREAVLTGNITDLFQHITGIGDDPVFYGRIGSPGLLIKDLDISG